MSVERAINAVLGVGGGIAAYKAAELARSLEEQGVGVQVVMTAAAREFIQPLTFAALTGRKVITEMFPSDGASGDLASAVEHIGVAQSHQLLIVAPATADLIAKFAHGLATDFLTTLYLAFEGPVVLAPAMNTAMWEHPATRENMAILRQRGHIVVEPEHGLLACGTVGQGRLADVEEIARAAAAVCRQRHDLDGETLLVTAGPTQEPLDPVRYITNRSSGKMGYALAEAAAARGARVVLVSGPVNLKPPYGVELVRVETAVEMYNAVMAHLSAATIIVKAAAVADYHLAEVPLHKLKKTAKRLSLQLDPTPDILAEIGRTKDDRLLIGFAAETDNLIEEARRKLTSKNCDMVVANQVGPDGSPFETDTNKVVLALRTGEIIDLAVASKRQIADQIFDQALRLRLLIHAGR
jgi:phosphopantothenoylcysteine decarboxylase / phosphopantothenate---cysteine ligase